MARICVDMIQPGMLLSGDVRDITGRLLLKAGSVIAERHLYIFKAWGVTGAEIEVSQDRPEQKVETWADPGLMAHIDADLRKIFIHANLEEPFVKELFLLAGSRRAKILSGADV